MTQPTPRVLCPLRLVDSSEGAVLAYAIELANGLRTTVRALHVYELGNERDWLAARGFVQGAVQRPRSQLVDHLAALDSSSMVSSTFLEGPADTRILEEAARLDVDFIVMGTRGRRAIGRLVLGSVAQRVLRASTIPVIAVPRRMSAAPPISSILVAHDLSCIASNRALEFAHRLRLALSTPTVDVIHVLADADLAEDAELRRWDATRQLERDIQRVCGPDWQDIVTLRVVEGDPLEQILTVQREVGADLLAVGSSNKPGFVRLVLGSVAMGLLGESGVPVLVAPRVPSSP